ncbi:MAG TPA: hypothetical protein VGO81_13015, partial [Solirubrobacteraceae bacterium]|nr:hypothetical protein [Solirubrobacteraceae bacterium]
MFAWLQPLWSRRRAAALIGAAGVSAAAAAFLPPVAAAVVVAVAVMCCGLAVGTPPDPRDHALRRHLAICRRREERAFVLVASALGRRRAMTADLRISDSSVAASRRGNSTL